MDKGRHPLCYMVGSNPTRNNHISLTPLRNMEYRLLLRLFQDGNGVCSPAHGRVFEAPLYMVGSNPTKRNQTTSGRVLLTDAYLNKLTTDRRFYND